MIKQYGLPDKGKVLHPEREVALYDDTQAI